MSTSSIKWTPTETGALSENVNGFLAKVEASGVWNVFAADGWHAHTGKSRTMFEAKWAAEQFMMALKESK